MISGNPSTLFSPITKIIAPFILKKNSNPLKRGTLSIHVCCQKIKQTTDNLADVGHPVSDKQLVLQTFHCLRKTYSTVIDLISFQNPLRLFPPFPKSVLSFKWYKRACIVQSLLNSHSTFPKHIIVGNGSQVPVTAQDHASLPNSPFSSF